MSKREHATYSSVLVIVPSRERPENINRLCRAWSSTHAKADLLVLVDDDDPRLGEYRVLAKGWQGRMELEVGERMAGMAPLLNVYANLKASSYDVLGFMGDDHLPKTPSWDRKIAKLFQRPGIGIVYGDDKFQGENLPTAVFIRSSIVEALGYFCPPGLVHLYLDNSWLRWGREAGCIEYRPDIVIEHLHPIAHKAPVDEGYTRVNSEEMYAKDAETFQQYAETHLNADVEKIRAVLAA